MAFKKGEGGRVAGTPNKSTREIRDVLNQLALTGKTDTHLARLHQLVQSDDEQVAVKALALVLAYRFGKPKETIDLHVPEPVRVCFVDAPAA